MPFQQHLLGFGDRLGRVQTFRAGLGAVHDRVTTVQAEWIIEFIEILKLDVAFLYDLLGATQEHVIKTAADYEVIGYIFENIEVHPSHENFLAYAEEVGVIPGEH